MEENNNLSPKEIYDQKKQEKEDTKKKERVQEKIKKTPKKIGIYIKRITIIVAVFVLIGWLLSLIPSLPPVSQENHVEQSPIAHIITTRMPDAVQRHMLEHADGSGPAGIIIQYNCDNYDCASDLIDKLATLVEEYPTNVYLAPNKYDGKIILTRVGRKLVLDTFDEEQIRNFIEK